MRQMPTNGGRSAWGNRQFRADLRRSPHICRWSRNRCTRTLAVVGGTPFAFLTDSAGDGDEKNDAQLQGAHATSGEEAAAFRLAIDLLPTSLTVRPGRLSLSPDKAVTDTDCVCCVIFVGGKRA